MPSITRDFRISDNLSFRLHEPSLTEDNLGLKTWTSSLLLSQRLPELRKHIMDDHPRVLELGSGTGLVGMAAACLWNTHVLLTDLPAIVPNLQKNLEQNRGLIEGNDGSVTAQQLDWNDEKIVPKENGEKFMVILAADPIYSSDHPKMLVNTISRWLSSDPRARLIVELPLRDRYDEERQSLRSNLREQNFELIAEGSDSGFDDWSNQDGNAAEVECWWSVWKLVSVA